MDILYTITDENLNKALQFYIAKNSNVEKSLVTIVSYDRDELISGEFKGNLFGDKSITSVQFKLRDIEMKLIVEDFAFIFDILREFFKDLFSTDSILIEEISDIDDESAQVLVEVK